MRFPPRPSASSPRGRPLGRTYRITRALEAEAGYRFTYFFQHEKSHEDDNTFQFIDNGFRLGLSFRF